METRSANGIPAGHQQQSPLPRKKFIAILITTLTEPLCLTIFFPYMYFYIRDLQVAADPKDIGFYAGSFHIPLIVYIMISIISIINNCLGILAATFSFAQFLTSLIWGYLADRIGTRSHPFTFVLVSSLTICCSESDSVLI